jgi:hypothetical protein
MSSEKFDLFLILLRLKSYLISLMDDPSLGYEGFEYTNEYLERKFPERKEEVLELLISNKIETDAQIAFDEKIHHKFKEMVDDKENTIDLPSILEKNNIIAIDKSIQERGIEKFRSQRDGMLRDIVTVLFQMANSWTQRSEIENKIQDYSLLNEEDVIRPEEKKKLDELDENTSFSYNTISKLTQHYLNHLVEYYFQFGGDIPLMEFIDSLDDFKKSVYKKYFNLIKNSGLDPNQLK